MRDFDHSEADSFVSSNSHDSWRRLSWTIPVFAVALAAAFAAWLFTPEPNFHSGAVAGPINAAEVDSAAVTPAEQRLRNLMKPLPEVPGLLGSPEEIVPDWPIGEPFTALILGIDRRGADPSGRTDTMIWLRVDPRSATAVAVSIPRDICIAVCQTRPVRINAAKDLFGVDGLKREVAGLIGQPVDYYVAMEFPGFVELVDHFGGIDVFVEKEIRDRNFPAVDDSQFEYFFLPQGQQHLDGATALKFVRTRYQDGDFGRVERQQQFLRAARDQLVAPTLIVQAPTLLAQLGSTFDTDIPLLSVPSLIKLAARIPSSAIDSGVIDYQMGMVEPFTSENGAQVLLSNGPVIRSYVAELIAETTTRPTTQPIDPTSEDPQP